MPKPTDFLVISQARTGSTRLPGKVLLKAAGKELLLHFIDRVLLSKRIAGLIIATTTEPRDEAIVKLVGTDRERCQVFRGSEENVLDRYYQAALGWKQESGREPVILRITSDCPLIDPRVIDAHIAAWEAEQPDYLSSFIHRRTWPHGMDIQMFTFALLEKAWQHTDFDQGREHVVPWMSRQTDLHSYECSCTEDLADLRLTVDYPEDYELIKRVFEHFLPHSPDFSMKDIVSFLSTRPEIRNINRVHGEKRSQ